MKSLKMIRSLNLCNFPEYPWFLASNFNFNTLQIFIGVKAGSLIDDFEDHLSFGFAPVNNFKSLSVLCLLN